MDANNHDGTNTCNEGGLRETGEQRSPERTDRITFEVKESYDLELKILNSVSLWQFPLFQF